MKFLSTKTLVLFVISALLVLSLPVLAQETFGDISGVAKDPSGAVLADVTVTVTNKATNRVLTIKTRGDGSFTAADVEPGRYSVSFEKQGFGKFQVPDVQVLLGKTTTVDASLKVGAASEVVEVSAAAQTIDTSSTMVAHNVTIEELDRLPKGRNFEAIALLSPSVNTGYVEGGFQINGASAAENNYYVDGVSTNSAIDGSARQSATFDYLQEVQVKTTGLDAEYGGALGGVVSAVTKSGGNEFHGDLHYYYYGSKLNADPAKRLAVDTGTPTPGPYTDAYFQDSKPQNDNHEFGGSLGGPIIKQKLWFYTAASPRWQRRANDYIFKDGSSLTPGSIARKAHQMNWFNKVSWDPTSRIRTNFTWLYTPSYLLGNLPAYNAFGSNLIARSVATAAADSKLGYRQAENSVTGQVDFTLTNTSLLSVKSGRYFLNYVDTGVSATKQYVWSGSSLGIAGVPAEWQKDDGQRTSSAAQTAHDLTTRTYVQADLSQLFNLVGQHNFKFGIGTTKNVNNVLDTQAPDGIVTLFFNQGCGVCGAGGGRGAYGYYSVDREGTIGTAGSNITHLYFQDSWKLMRRLTVNAGVRLEKETIPSFRTDIKKNAIEFGYGDKIAPRVGASFDLFGNGKVKLSGGWGRYYDWTKYDLPRGAFGGDFWWTYYRTLDDPSVIGSISLNNMPGTNLWPSDHQDLRLPSFDTLDPNVKPMSSDSLNAGVEWEISKGMVFTGRYVRSKLNRTIEDMGVLDANGSEAYRYGNPGEGDNVFVPASGASCPKDINGTCAVPMPKAKRVYDALELSVARRFGNGFLFNAGYVYSRLWGNYAGLQSTDEIRPATTGRSYAGNQAFTGQSYRPGGNANRYFDLDEAFYDANGNNGLYGLLPTDRPHVFKFYGAKEFKFGTEVGGFFRASSGTPVTTQVNTVHRIPMYVEGRGDAGRTPFFSQTDLMVAHTFKVDEVKRLRFEMNVVNLFNQKTATFMFDRYTREDHATSTGMRMANVDLTQGFDWKALVAARGNDLDSRYGKEAEFNPGISARFLVKFIF